MKTIVKNVLSLNKGKKPKSTVVSIENGYLPYVDIKAFEKGIVEKYTNDEKCVPCEDGDLLIVCDGSRSGLVGRAVKGYVGSTLARIDIDKSVLPEYIYHFIQGKYIQLNTSIKGTGTPHLNQELLKSFELYVPPLEDQHRIVTRIEELFSQLDSGVETLKKTKEQLKVYRQAVLKEAFEGNYTKVKLNEISTAISGYAFKSKEYTSDGRYIVIKIGNVKPFRFDFSRDCTKTNEVDESIINKYLLKEGDCLITLTGSRGKYDYGYVSMITDQTNYLLNQRVAALRFDQTKAFPLFYEYYLSSFDYRNQFFSFETGNVGQGNVGIKALTEPYVIAPSINEQKKIVNEIESRLSVCDSIEKTIDNALQQAEALRQSILKKAFEGEL